MRKTFKFKWILICGLLLDITGCIDPFETKVEQGEKRLVVQGHITNAPGPYQVILSYSGNYSRLIDGIAEYISGAFVCIHDDQGDCMELFEEDNGVYKTWDEDFQGEIGRNYHLEIILPNGRRYLSVPEPMIKPPEISNIYYEYHTETVLDPEGFYVYIDTNDPADQVNFYKWETVSWYLYSWDPCWKRVPDFIPFNIASDKNINGNKIAKRLLKIVPYNSRMPYVVTAYQLGLSENAYQYLKELNDQINLSGSIFDPPPTFIRGNMKSDADPDEIVLGYFYVAGTSNIEIAVDRSIPEHAPSYYAPIADAPLYCGDPCNWLCVSFGGGKCGLPPCPPECNDLPNVTYKPPDSWPLHENICDE
jgi:hypothetical protein